MSAQYEGVEWGDAVGAAVTTSAQTCARRPTSVVRESGGEQEREHGSVRPEVSAA